MQAARFAIGTGLAAAAFATSAATYSLAGDWSDAADPNGAWAYGLSNGSDFGAFPTHVSSYINVGPAAFTSAQPAWTSCAATGDNGCPQGLARSIGVAAAGKDFPLGRVGGHTPLSGWLAVQWTAPAAGTVDVSGAVWMWQDFGRTLVTTISVDGQPLFTPATIPAQAAGTSSSNPFSFAQAAASVGASASVLQGLAVQAGDTIVWMATEAPGSTEWFVGVDMTVNFAPVPENGTLTLLGAGLALLLLRCHRPAQRRVQAGESRSRGSTHQGSFTH